MTELKGLLKRQLMIGKTTYAVTLSTESIKLVVKGRRKGLEIKWLDWVSGDAALAIALRASLDMASSPPKAGSAAKQGSTSRSKLKRVKRNP